MLKLVVFIYSYLLKPYWPSHIFSGYPKPQNTTMTSSFNVTAAPNFDNLLLQSLMSRRQIRPSSPHLPPFMSTQSLEDLLFNNLLSDEDEDSDDDFPSSKSHLAKEESRLEKQIIRTILSGNTDSLKPNSGQAVAIGEHHICVGFCDDSGPDYRVWEWHGHIMLFDDEEGYTTEYVYGNYFERLSGEAMAKRKQSEEEEKVGEKFGNLGLRELIETGEESSKDGRILRRNLNAGSQSRSSGDCF